MPAPSAGFRISGGTGIMAAPKIPHTNLPQNAGKKGYNSLHLEGVTSRIHSTSPFFISHSRLLCPFASGPAIIPSRRSRPGNKAKITTVSVPIPQNQKDIAVFIFRTFAPPIPLPDPADFLPESASASHFLHIFVRFGGTLRPWTHSSSATS
jgi:hypothetical protein